MNTPDTFVRRWLIPIALAFFLGGAFVVGGILLGQHFKNRGFEIIGIVMAFAVPLFLVRKGNDDQSPDELGSI